MSFFFHARAACLVRRFTAAGLCAAVLLASHASLQGQQSAPQSATGANSANSASSVTAVNQQLSTASDYVIRQGDMIQVSVFNEPELAVSGRVRNDGTIQCPLIGSIHLEGLTQLSAARIVQEAYRKDYLVNPEVNLFVSQFSTRRITVLGQVQRPGAHELPAEKNLTILQVLGLAGGPTRIANLKKVMVKRIVEGREQVVKVDVHAMASGARTMMFYVREDDVITVPESFF